MTTLVNLVFHFGGSWELVEGKLEYLKGDIDVLYDFDVDYLCYNDLLARYREGYGFKLVQKIFVLKLGEELENGLFLVHDDRTIRKVLDYINKYSWVAEVEFYADYEIDTPLFTPKVLEIEFLETEPEQEIEEPTTCTGNGVGCNVTEPEVNLNIEVSFDSNTLVPDATEQPGEVGTQFSFVNAVSGEASAPGAPESASEAHAEPATEPASFDDNATIQPITEIHQTEPNVTEDPSRTPAASNYVGPEGYISESEDESEHDGNQTDFSSDETIVENDGTTPPRERVRYDGADGQGHLMLGMTFANAQEARGANAQGHLIFVIGLQLLLNCLPFCLL